MKATKNPGSIPSSGKSSRSRASNLKVCEENYGYIRVSTFQDKTTEDFQTALKKLESTKGGLKGLSFDLRNDPGGLLNEAVKVADEFLDSGIIVSIQGRIKDQNSKFHAHPNKTPILIRSWSWSMRAAVVIPRSWPGHSGSKKGDLSGHAHVWQGVGPDHHPAGGWFRHKIDHRAVLYSQRTIHSGQGDHSGYTG